jgi:hypothetical protein
MGRARNLAQRIIDTARRGELSQAIPRWLARLGGKQPFSGEGINLSYLDTDLGLDTGGAVNLPALTADGLPYYGIAPSIFSSIMDHITLDRSEATFVDFGSGKGRALFLAAACGFRRIVGVEVLEVLHKVAVENIGKYKTATGNPIPIEPVLSDVASFEIPSGPLLAYFYNPFGAKTMKQVIRNLEEAHNRTGQRIDIAYCHPSFENLLDEQTWLHKAEAFEAVLTPDERARCVMGLDSLRVACYSTSAT